MRSSVSINPPAKHFRANHLLKAGMVWDNDNLTRIQRWELDQLASNPENRIIKEELERDGERVTVWRYEGVRPL